MLRDWRGLAAFVLAVGVVACLVIAFVSAADADRSVEPQIVNLLFAALGGVIGILAGYVRHSP
jgi:hypothetical protein